MLTLIAKAKRDGRLERLVAPTRGQNQHGGPATYRSAIFAAVLPLPWKTVVAVAGDWGGVPENEVFHTSPAGWFRHRDFGVANIFIVCLRSDLANNEGHANHSERVKQVSLDV